MHHLLEEELKRHISLSDSVIEALMSCITKDKIKSRTIILQSSHVQEVMYFITKGIVRNYYKAGGREWTSFFFSARRFGVKI